MFKKEITKMILILLIVNMYLQTKKIEKVYTDKNGNTGDQGSTYLEMHKKSVDIKDEKEKASELTKYLNGKPGRTDRDKVCCKYFGSGDYQFKEVTVNNCVNVNGTILDPPACKKKLRLV